MDQSSSVSRKWGFSDFRPPRHIFAVCEPISTKFLHNVQMSTKSRKIRGSRNLGLRKSPTPNFFRENAFFQAGVRKKRIFRKRKNWGGEVQPQICRQKVQKLGVFNFWGQGRVPPQEIFFPKMRFFEWALEKMHF